MELSGVLVFLKGRARGCYEFAGGGRKTHVENKVNVNAMLVLNGGALGGLNLV